MFDFTAREKSILGAGLQLLRHDVPHLKSEISDLEAATPKSPWPSEAELDALCEKIATMDAPDPATDASRR